MIYPVKGIRIDLTCVDRKLNDSELNQLLLHLTSRRMDSIITSLNLSRWFSGNLLCIDNLLSSSGMECLGDALKRSFYNLKELDLSCKLLLCHSL